MTELPSFSVAGQVALVTGASSGIGLHLAEILALAGAKVALAARRTDRLEQACAAIRERGGICLPVALDVTSGDSIAAAVDTVETGLGPLSVLVNNAGVVVSKPFFEHTEEDWDHVVDTNLKGVADGARVRPSSCRQAARRADYQYHLSAEFSYDRKNSLLSRCKSGTSPSQRRDGDGIGEYNVLVNAIAPGYVVTDFNRDFLESEAGLKLAARVPLKRVGQVEDLSGALLFLASPASAYITGACISVDGGHGVAAI